MKLFVLLCLIASLVAIAVGCVKAVIVTARDDQYQLASIFVLGVIVSIALAYLLAVSNA